MCSTEKSIASRLSSLLLKLKSSKSDPTKLTPEQEDLVASHFSTRFRTMFTSSHLFHFLPANAAQEQENFDELVIRHLKKPSVYQDFGRIYDSSKLGRALVELGMKEKFVAGYIKWKREAQLGTTFDGCGWNEDWVYEIGGARGAVIDIMENF
ncbi:hypothetical protein H072_1863 [Dactylellina haptotyla CBS 200.50]|uniref:Uncharacterized protein n=1 Tax=Dactylellina haptotyla (strain CBS 200.50) TaxID=1284197 RepID=S8AMN7_DACHA|nr:hypothetical protein H072_1863 [Dactylellina haptotyla CBS 200.50]